jgi:hypothetical protein
MPKMIAEGFATRISNRRLLHLYECERCGGEKLIERRQLPRSKGCVKCRATAHGMAGHKDGTAIYKLWNSIIRRCENPKHNAFASYGGRGISMCHNWRGDFLCFAEWCINNGWKSGLQVDRIDVNAGYSPENCRLVSNQVNSQNRRFSKLRPDDVRAIRMLSWSGVPSRIVAKIFDVSHSMIVRIMGWQTWSNV